MADEAAAAADAGGRHRAADGGAAAGDADARQTHIPGARQERRAAAGARNPVAPAQLQQGRSQEAVWQTQRQNQVR